MKQAQVTTLNSPSFYDLLTLLELHRHQKNMTSMHQNRATFMLLQDDLNALQEKEGIYIQPLPEKTYCDSGTVRVVVQVNEADFQNKVCLALIRRGYFDINESSKDVRLLKRENIIFTVTTTPQHKYCASVTSVTNVKAYA